MLAAPDKEGVAYRTLLEGLLKRARNPEKIAEYEAALELPPFPIPLKYLWAIFWRLRRRKGYSDRGPQPIEWSDIDAFLRRSSASLTPWEVEIIEDLDDAYLSNKSHDDGEED